MLLFSCVELELAIANRIARGPIGVGADAEARARAIHQLVARRRRREALCQLSARASVDIRAVRCARIELHSNTSKYGTVIRDQETLSCSEPILYCTYLKLNTYNIYSVCTVPVPVP